MKIDRLWLWLVPLTLFWPLLHLFIFFVRFKGMPRNVIDNVVFLPMSLVSGIFFLVLWICATKRSQKTGLILGYLFASPIAYIGSLLSGLVYQPIIGTLLWGAGPLVLGMLIGYFLTKIGSKRV